MNLPEPNTLLYVRRNILTPHQPIIFLLQPTALFVPWKGGFGLLLARQTNRNKTLTPTVLGFYTFVHISNIYYEIFEFRTMTGHR